MVPIYVTERNRIRKLTNYVRYDNCVKNYAENGKAIGTYKKHYETYKEALEALITEAEETKKWALKELFDTVISFD
jgi:hypothetical protein